jgi:tetratricopeptide (TPR) repeat protein
MRSLLFCFCFAIFWPGFVHGQEVAPALPQKPITGFEVVTSGAEARGLYDRAAREWLNAAQTKPASTIAELALLRLENSRHLLASTRKLIAPLRILSRNEKASEQVRWLAGKLLIKYLRESGDWREASGIAARLGLLENWLAIGPFGRDIAASNDNSFGPEKDHKQKQFTSGVACDFSQRKWRILPIVEPALALVPAVFLRKKGGVYYLLAQVKQVKPRFDICMFVETDEAFKVWVNGRQVCDGDRNRQLLPNVVGFPVDLDREGWNSILLKISGPGSIQIRTTDTQGRPVSLHCEKKLLLHSLGKKLQKSVPSGDPVARSGKRMWGPLRPVATKTSEQVVLGLLRSFEGRDEQALALLWLATDKKQVGRASWHFLAGEVTRRARLLGPSDRRSKSSEAYRAALKIDPGFVPALLRLAVYEIGDDREEEALALLARAVVAAPASSLPKIRMAEIAARLDWRNQAFAWLADAQKLRPDFRRCRQLDAFLQIEGGQLDRAIAIYREIIRDNEADRLARNELLTLIRRRGRWRDALKLQRQTLSLWPADPQAHHALILCQQESEDYQGAVLSSAVLLKLMPEVAAYWETLGDVQMRAGKRAEAMRAYDQALRLNPAAHRLRRMLARLKGVDEDFSAVYQLDIHKELAQSRKRSYPRANIVRVLDQTVVRVYPGGSSVSIITNGERALTPRAVRKLGQQPLLGEILEARTIRPDGSVMEPTIIPGQGRLTMPGLDVDAAIETKYRIERSAARVGGFYLGKWYFRSPGLDEPHQVSDYIVMVPKGLAHKVVRHNFDVPERVEEKDGLLIYRWQARNRKRVESERHMPHFDNFLPFVEVGTERSWQDIADSFRSAYMGRTLPTELVVKTVRKILSASKSKSKTELEKSRLLYDALNRLVRKPGRADTAHQALESGAGDREMVFLALARAAGLKVFQGRARTAPAFQGRNVPPATWSLPSESLVFAELVGVKRADGRILWLDLSSVFMPFGEIRTRLLGSRVLAVPDRQPAFFERLPQPDYNKIGVRNSLQLKITAAGNLSGHASQRVIGVEAGERRAWLKVTDAAGRRNKVQTEINRAFPGAALLQFKFEESKPQGALLTKASFSLEGYLVAAPKGRFYCPMGILGLKLLPYLAVEASRIYPLKIAYPEIARDDLELSFQGLSVEELPEPLMLSGKFGTYSLEITAVENGYRLQRRMLILPQTISVSDYKKFRDFCSRIDEAEKGMLLVRKTSQK